MRHGGASTAILAAVLLVPAALAQAPATWDELAGGAARTGAAFLPTSTLDVLAARDLLDGDTLLNTFYTKAVVSTPHGLVALAERDEACVLVTVRGEDVAERVLDGCEEGALTAYDRVRDRILVCASATSDGPVFQARDAATGELAWAVRPVDLATEARPPTTWRCRGTALVGDDAFVAFWTDQGVANSGVGVVAATATVVARIALEDGGEVWARSIGSEDLRAPNPPLLDVDNSPGGFIPFGISVAETGVVVLGRETCPCGAATDPTGSPAGFQQGAAVWLDAESGSPQGAAVAVGPGEAQERVYAPWWAPTQGPLAAFTLGERLLVVNPAEEQPVREGRFAPVESGRGFIGVNPPAWWGDTLVVPLGLSLTGVDATTLASRWSWTPGADWRVSALLAVPPSDVLVLAAAAVAGERDVPAVVHRLDLATGRETQRLPLPGTIPITTGTGRAAFHPHDDGTLLVHALDGGLFVLGAADAALRPRLAVDDAYPAPGAPVTVAVAAPDPAASYVVAWGDGTVVEGGTSWTHRYGEEGAKTARVTARFADGRTATTESVVRVGETPPQRLTPLQRAVAPENYDLTFGLLGVVLTAAGAGVAVLARRRRHGRLHDELRALEDIRLRGRSDPEGAVRALGEFRERLLADMGAHRLDDGQFNTLDARANVVFAALRTRLLGPSAGRLSSDFRHALDVVLHDGRVDGHELADLRTALSHEPHLSPEERERLAALLARLADAP